MRKTITAVLLLFSLILIPVAYADFPPNPQECCIDCPVFDMEMCFWNDDNYLYVSADPQTEGYLCAWQLAVIQDSYQYDDYWLIDKLDNHACGYIYTYTEARIAEWYDKPSSPFDPTRAMSIVIDSCASSTPVFYEYNGECAVTTTSTTSIPTTTTSVAGIFIPCPIMGIYGEHSAETELLRSLRDNVLNKTQEGRELIKLYYQWSPLIVQAMEADEEFKQEVKELIDGMLRLIILEVE